MKISGKSAYSRCVRNVKEKLKVTALTFSFTKHGAASYLKKSISETETGHISSITQIKKFNQ